MQLSTFYIAIFAIICLFASYTTAAFADKKWLTDLDEAKQIAAQEQKPILVQFTKTGCGPCNQFKSSFTGYEDEKFDELAKEFVLVHFLDSAGSKYPELSPDGQYFPHTVFLTPDGKVQPQIFNQLRVSGQNPEKVQYKYFYHTLSSLNLGMNTALSELK